MFLKLLLCRVDELRPAVEVDGGGRQQLGLGQRVGLGFIGTCKQYHAVSRLRSTILMLNAGMFTSIMRISAVYIKGAGGGVGLGGIGPLWFNVA